MFASTPGARVRLSSVLLDASDALPERVEHGDSCRLRQESQVGGEVAGSTSLLERTATGQAAPEHRLKLSRLGRGPTRARECSQVTHEQLLRVRLDQAGSYRFGAVSNPFVALAPWGS